jgi:hypothetical protein
MSPYDKANDIANNKWLPDIICALQSLGGIARLKQIYHWIHLNRQNLPPEWEAVIRAAIYSHSSDAKAYVIGNPDIFINQGRGLWALRYPQEKVGGKSYSDLSSQILANMSIGQFQSFSGKGDEFIAHIHKEVDKLKEKYKIIG